MIRDTLLKMKFPSPIGMRQRFILIDVATYEGSYRKGTAEIAIKIGASKVYTARAVRNLVNRGLLNRTLEETADGQKIRTLTLSDELKKRIEEAE